MRTDTIINVDQLKETLEAIATKADNFNLFMSFKYMLLPDLDEEEVNLIEECFTEHLEIKSNNPEIYNILYKRLSTDHSCLLAWTSLYYGIKSINYVEKDGKDERIEM